MLFINILKAFNSIVLKRLLVILKAKGLSFYFIKLIKSYISNREIFLVLSKEELEVY